MSADEPHFHCSLVLMFLKGVYCFLCTFLNMMFYSVCVCSFRDALLKMRDVYERSPQMGDASGLEPRLEEVKQSLMKLEEELRRNQVISLNTMKKQNTQCPKTVLYNQRCT